MEQTADLAAVLDGVHYAYAGAHGAAPTPALTGLGFAVRRGEMFGLVGPDGAGKTTSIRLLLGLLRADRGRVRTLGHDPVAEAGYVKSHVGYLSQRFTLYGDLTVAENIEFFGEIHRVRDMREQMQRLLDFTLLGPYRRRRADQLSGGMQKKLALACTLIHRPQLILLDEPTTGVDPISRREFWTLLHTLIRDGVTVLLTTPYLDEAERCTRVALVRGGRTLVEDDPVRLRQTYGRPTIEVVCDPVRVGRDLLAASSRVAEVQLFGDRLHAVPVAADDGLTDLVADLAAQGVQVHHQRPVVPSLEDVFITLVRHDQGAAGAAP
ncbi:MAG: ABC transporter ATP-binding protein [Deltaproteobacteria bacterium]|nr:ABC transporter ATP-binding protein [Deltaproteobacteria bacterium]